MAVIVKLVFFGHAPPLSSNSAHFLKATPSPGVGRDLRRARPPIHEIGVVLFSFLTRHRLSSLSWLDRIEAGRNAVRPFHSNL